MYSCLVLGEVYRRIYQLSVIYQFHFTLMETQKDFQRLYKETETVSQVLDGWKIFRVENRIVEVHT